MDENKIISLENLNQYSDETSDKIKSYVNTKTSVIQDGTKTVGGVSAEDYNNFKSAYEDKHTHSNKSVLDEISEKTLKGGAELSGSTGYTVTDSVEYPIVGLKVFGKSTQDGTPTPENPVEITSVVEPTVTVCGKNLFKPTLETTTKNGVTLTNNGDGTYTLNGTAIETVWFNVNHILGRVTLPEGTYKLVGWDVNNKGTADSVMLYFEQKTSIRDYGYGGTKFTLTEEKTYSLAIVIIQGKILNNVVIKPMITTDLTATYDDFEQYKGNTATIPDTLNAIPVTSGGNVTIDGQEYIADYVDYERGVKVQRVEAIKLSADNFLQFDVNRKCVAHGINQHIVEGNSVYYTMCNCLVPSFAAWSYESGSKYFIYNTIMYMWTQNFGIETEEDWKTFIANNDIIVYHALATPIESPISKVEIQAYRQLQTYNGVTNISNDKVAGLSVQYCTSKMLAKYALPLIKDLEAENAKKDEEISALKTDILTSEKIHNRIYEGVNLAEKFASEIAAAPYNGNPWAWIKARITAENFTGIRVGDYIPFITTNGVTLNAQIAGINTYKNYGDTPVGSHIDFICKELWGTLHPVNKVNYNNGTESQPYPWLASDLYLYLNSLSGSVPNSATVNPEMVDVDYTADGVYYYLPEALKNVIIEKRFLLPKRYSASGLLTDDNQWGWTNIGKLWLPDECEVYGIPVWGGKGGYSLSGSSLQYPIFTGNMNRLKFRNGIRSHWWLLSPYLSNSSFWCVVYNGGGCDAYNAYSGGIAAPVCFRV